MVLGSTNMKTAETVVWYHDDSDGGRTEEEEEEQDNWYSRSLMILG
jgi:hypothetical protein